MFVFLFDMFAVQPVHKLAAMIVSQMTYEVSSRM